MPHSTFTYAALEADATLEDHAPLALEEAVILGSNVERLRVNAGLGVSQFAAVADISRPFIYKVERGEANPKLTELKKLSIALGVSVAELLMPPPEREPMPADQPASR